MHGTHGKRATGMVKRFVSLKDITHRRMVLKRFSRDDCVKLLIRRFSKAKRKKGILRHLSRRVYGRNFVSVSVRAPKVLSYQSLRKLSCVLSGAFPITSSLSLYLVFKLPRVNARRSGRIRFVVDRILHSTSVRSRYCSR